jgi:NADH/NAD ratio-sensing transcriptional regulator Rex
MKALCVRHHSADYNGEAPFLLALDRSHSQQKAQKARHYLSGAGTLANLFFFSRQCARSVISVNLSGSKLLTFVCATHQQREADRLFGSHHNWVGNQTGNLSVQRNASLKELASQWWIDIIADLWI